MKIQSKYYVWNLLIRNVQSTYSRKLEPAKIDTRKKAYGPKS